MGLTGVQHSATLELFTKGTGQMKIYKINDFQIWYSSNTHWVCYPVDTNGNFIPVTKYTFQHTTHKTKEEAITFAKSKEKSG